MQEVPWPRKGALSWKASSLLFFSWNVREISRVLVDVLVKSSQRLGHKAGKIVHERT